jgi:Tetratricopeptide repeat
MRQFFLVVLAAAWCWSVQPLVCSQAPPNSGSSQSQAPKNSTPNGNAPKPKSQGEANPFPEDTNTVPVMPNANSSGTPTPAPEDTPGYYNLPLPNAEKDPVRSPDDADSNEGISGSSGSSSSSAGLDDLLKPPPDVPKTGKHAKDDDTADTNAVHREGPKEDESVGSYYLDQKNWKAALSRFESALVLDPENPDVYWGLGEAERHLGNFASAKAHYTKVVEYDPDSKHGKEAKKILKEPEIANAPAVSSNAPAASPQQ